MDFLKKLKKKRIALQTPLMLNKGINVRLDPEIRERLERIARNSGVKASVLIREAIRDYCNAIESRGAVSFRIKGNHNTTHVFSSGATGEGRPGHGDIHLNEDSPEYGGKKKKPKK